MLVRHLTPAETVDFEKIGSIAFLFPINVEEIRKKAEEKPEETNSDIIWGCFDDAGRLTGGLVNWPLHMYYDGNEVGMGGIGGVASLPEARMRGGIRSIFKALFEEDRKNGVLFSTLYPFSHRYYRQFGYEICNETRAFKFETRTENLKKYRQRGQVRMWEKEEGSASFAALYAQFAKGYTYAAMRDEKAWKRMLEGDFFKEQQYRYILSLEGKDVAYCMFKVLGEREGAPTLNVQDWAYVGREGLYELLGFFAKLNAQFGKVRMEVPDDMELSVLMGEPYEVEADGMIRTMARVIDVRKALELMRHPEGEGRYSIEVEDDFLPVNTGVYTVSYGDGGVQVEMATEARADMSITVQTFAQLCLGHIDLSMAALKPDVQVNANRETLEKVFVKKPKYFTDRF